MMGYGERSRGVSLIEMVIALAILGMLATISLGGVRLGVRTWETVDRRVDVESRGRIVRSFLSRTLSQALPVTDADNARALFEGGQEELSLIAPMADQLGLGGAQRIRLFLEEAAEPGSPAGRWRLVLLRSLYVPAGADGDAGADPDAMERHVLLDDIAGAKFAYLRETESGAREWVGRWDGELPLPRLVRLTIDARPGAPAWPPIIAPLRIDATAVAR